MCDGEEFRTGLYENGHWVWDDEREQIVYLNHLSPSVEEDPDELYIYAAPTDHIQFRDDVDPVEQLRYRRHFQRKVLPGQPDIVTLQDVKDFVIYTAPANFLSIKLIKMLHTPTGERFLRALILYCAYAIQVTNFLTVRNIELETKVRTVDSEIMENEFRDNLSDLRVLVAKEYSVILTGADDMKPFHHMGLMKNKQSLIDKDARKFEIFVKISVQIVYLALGRKYFPQIEIETNRILKSESFNTKVQATHKDDTEEMKAAIIKDVIYGNCFRRSQRLNMHSPLMNEIFCGRQRSIDYRMLGLGVTKYPDLTPRLKFLRLVMAGTDKELVDNNINVGIIGLPRELFDTTLQVLPPATASTAQESSRSKVSIAKSAPLETKSTFSKKSTIGRNYPEIVILPKETVQLSAPKGFIEEPDVFPPINAVQLRLWIRRFQAMVKLLKRKRRHRSREKLVPPLKV